MLSWYLCQAISDVKREVSQLDASPGVGTARRLREAICNETPYTNYHTQTYHEGPSSYTSIPYMPQMIITSLILNPLNLIPILAYTHNFLLDRQTTVR